MERAKSQAVVVAGPLFDETIASQAAAKMDERSVVLTDKETWLNVDEVSCYFEELKPIKVKGKEEKVSAVAGSFTRKVERMIAVAALAMKCARAP